jgi:hypothetical protein
VKARMYELFYLDGRCRMKMYAVSGGIAFLFGTLAMALGSQVQEAVFGSAALTLVLLGIWSFVYCSRQEKTKEAAGASWGLPTRRLAVSFSALVISFLVSLSTEKIEAAIINKKLKKYADAPALDEPGIETLISTLAYVRENDLKVNSELLARVGRKLATGSPAPDFHRAAELVANIQSEIHETPIVPRRASSWSNVTYNYFKGGAFSDSDVRLDTNAFEQSSFLRCRVQYEGGPVLLRATKFLKCHFEIIASPEGRALLAELAKGNEVNFSYRPEELLQVTPR